MRIYLFVFIFAALTFAQAQESPPARTVHLHFVPPPGEGTISLGIYDDSGKLVRILNRESAITDFTLGHDALETTWDGNDDAGHPLPAGRYHARGYLVGDLKVEGVAYFFNDWVTDAASPHLARISRIAVAGGRLILTALDPANKTLRAAYDIASEKLTINSPNESTPEPREIRRLPLPQGTIDPSATAPGKNGTIWRIISLTEGGTEVEQVTAGIALEKAPILRKLAIPPNDPLPIGIAASLSEERIFLLEQTPAFERVRSLTLIATQPDGADKAQTVSDWKVDFEKKIVGHENFILVEGKPALPAASTSVPPARITQALRRNPLQRDQPGKVELSVGFDADGSYLKTADGLPLQTVSDTKNLRRALLARKDDTALDFFQDDGAVVEQFRISQLDEMMAFDCGEFDLK